MATAVDQNGTIAIPDQCWNLIAPIAAVAEAAMQQDYRGARTVSAVPDPRSIMLDIALSVRDR